MFALALLLACDDGPGPDPGGRPDPGDTARPDDSGDTGDSGDTPTPPTFARVDALFDVPASPWFGVTAALEPKDPATEYRVPPPWEDNGDDLVQPWFDVGNNSLLAEIDVGGRVEYPVVRGPLDGFAQGVDGTASYAPTDFLAGSPWTFTVDVGDGPVALDRLDGTSVDVLGDRLFRWNSAVGDLAVSFVPFAPSDGALATPQPRALLAAFRLENTGTTPLDVALGAPEGVPDADHLDAVTGPATLYGPAPYAGANHTGDENWIPRFAEVGYAVPGYEAVLPLDGAAWDEGSTRVSVVLAPGEARVVTLGLLVGGGVAELAHTRDQLRAREPVDWLNGTWGRLDSLLGTLSVPDEPYVPEMMARYAMSADDAFLFDGTGRLHHDHGGSWVLMGLIAPEYLAALLPGGNLGVSCPAEAATVSWSLYGTTLPAILAGEVYRGSGATADYGAGSTFETQYRCLVAGILATEEPGVALYPSHYIWDGPSRGDYHTGSNLAVWATLTWGARFADELWGDPATAAAWSAKADEVRAALLAHGVIDSWFDDRFVEGAWADGHVDGDVTCHDGEEIMVGEAAIFDFVAADDPRRIRHGIAAMSTENGFYEPAVDAMYWADGAPVTAPGWLTALSGAADGPALEKALALWRSRTDVDGSMYWWPYDSPAADPADIRRRMSFADGVPIDTAKVDYATSNALALLVHDTFGLAGDAPTHTVTFRPNVPWSAFTWAAAPVGAARFDVAYTDDGHTVSATFTNREAEAWTATVEVVVPDGAAADGVAPTGRWYTRDSLSQTAELAPGESLTVALPYAPDTADACVAAAWDELAAAGEAVGDWQQIAWADADDDDLPEGWAFRLLEEARCADPAVEAAYTANHDRCAGLGWGADWATVCASFATISPASVAVVDQWNGHAIGLAPYRVGGEAPLAATGDLDGDGTDNLGEFTANGGASGSRARFAVAASGG